MLISILRNYFILYLHYLRLLSLSHKHTNTYLSEWHFCEHQQFDGYSSVTVICIWVLIFMDGCNVPWAYIWLANLMVSLNQKANKRPIYKPLNRLRYLTSVVGILPPPKKKKCFCSHIIWSKHKTRKPTTKMKNIKKDFLKNINEVQNVNFIHSD